MIEATGASGTVRAGCVRKAVAAAGRRLGGEPRMILFLHNRYRTTGGEERAVEDLLWLVREHLGEDAELLERDSARLGRGRAAAGLLPGGRAPDDVSRPARPTKARVGHAHNPNTALG